MTHQLTHNEIENILSFIQPNPHIPPDVAESLVNINKNKLRKQLKDQRIYPHLIPQLKQKIERCYYRSFVQPGSCVGIEAAQSIGEKQTQGNLNNFHKAGSSENEVHVVSKFSELLNASKEPKIQNCFVYFKYGNKSVPELRQTIGDTIVGLTLERVSKSFKVCLDRQEQDWYDLYATLYSDRFRDYTDCVSIEINTDILFTYKVHLQTITERLNEQYEDMTCIFSPDSKYLDIFVDTKDIDMDDDKLFFVNQDNVREVYLDEVVIPNIKKLVVSGIEGIHHIFFNRDNERKGEWMVETEGSNLLELLAHPDVDMPRVISNNVWDIYNIFGIEATREFMIRQFITVMPSINKCHITLLVDKMTYRGTINSISRYTMRGEENGPMGKASFEETLDNFIKAGINSQLETTKGVSASIICGKKPPIGTSICSIRTNVEMLPPGKNNTCIRLKVKESQPHYDTKNIIDLESKIDYQPEHWKEKKRGSRKIVVIDDKKVEKVETISTEPPKAYQKSYFKSFNYSNLFAKLKLFNKG